MATLNQANPYQAAGINYKQKQNTTYPNQPATAGAYQLLTQGKTPNALGVNAKFPNPTPKPNIIPTNQQKPVYQNQITQNGPIAQTPQNTGLIKQIQDEMAKRKALGVADNQTMNQFNANQSNQPTQPTTPTNFTAEKPPTVADTASTLANLINNPSPAVQKAQDALQQFKQQVAERNREINTSGTWTGRALGQQQQFTIQDAASQAALEGAVANALKQQEQGIAALTAAQGAVAPIQIAPGSTAVNPISGNQVAGGLGGYANYQTAQQVFNTASQYKDAVNSQGQAFNYDQTKTPQENWSNFQQNYLPNSRSYQSGLIGSGLSSNIGQQGGGQNPLIQSTMNQTNMQGYSQATKDYQDLYSQYQGASSLGNMLVETMSQGGINTADPKLANKTVNQIKDQLSSQDYARFISTLTNARSTYANILSSGGGTIPTEATNALNTILDPNASFGAIQASIKQLNSEVLNGRLIPAANKVNQYLSNLQSGTSVTGQNNQTSNSGGLYDF